MHNRNPRGIILRPIVSEKSYDMITHNRYTFEVHKRATKPQIADAVAEIFGVTVEKVNTMNVAGKPRRLRYRAGKTRSWKKAVVTLKEGDSIEFFEG
ncbi:MAG: 50S ribosomal protein L23 [Coriobacteriia bacterium]|jgi:large subunit ribosomal protein L23|nr:50S ribosomal protein L23 [Coriobacteriia bacterium]